MIKAFVFALLATSFTLQAHANDAKYCGIFKENGIRYFVFGTITDNNQNPNITGTTADPNGVVQVMQSGACYCVEGDAQSVWNPDDSTPNGYWSFDFAQVDHVYTCYGPNTLPKLIK